MMEGNELQPQERNSSNRHRTLRGQAPGGDYAPVVGTDDDRRASDVESEMIEFSSPYRRQKWTLGYKIRALICGFLILIAVVAASVWLLFPRQLLDGSKDNIGSLIAQWGKPSTVTEALARYKTDFLRDVVPKLCYSHNDYWREVPLYSALQAGCTGVETDVWLLDDDPQLYVGHDKAALTVDRTFESLYINPLRQTTLGIFDEHPTQTLLLLVDIKSDGVTTLQRIVEQIQPLRERGLLSYFKDGHVWRKAVTLAIGGRASFDALVANTTYRDYFFDAPLEKLSDDSVYDYTNSYCASVSFKEVVGSVQSRAGVLSAEQRQIIEAQLQIAKVKKIKARYWDTPGWPIAARNEIWHQLVEIGVDYLNVDDIKGAAEGIW